MGSLSYTPGSVSVNNTPLNPVPVEFTSAPDDPIYIAQGIVDPNNSTSAALGIGGEWYGTATDVSGVGGIRFSAKSDKAGSFYAQFSVDGTNWDSSVPYNLDASTNDAHILTPTKKWFRLRIVNTSGQVQGYLRAQTILGQAAVLTNTLSSTVQDDADAVVTKSVLMGQTSGGAWKYVPVTAEGHVETVIHGPRNPFGSIHTENLTPVFQADGVYGINSQLQRTTTSGTGGATTENSSFKVSTGATIYSFGTIQSRKRLRYRAGQGLVGRFAGLFSTPVADSIVVAGFGHAEDGVYYGFNGTTFGILYSRRGVRATYTLTVTGAATIGGNVIITLNDTAYTIAVTNSANIQRTVYEISIGTYSGWECYAVGATVVFVRNSVGATAGAFTFNANGTGSTATIAQTKAGATASETWYPQTQWNGDRLDGSGDPDTNPSGVLLDKSRGNVFQIGIQYLGYGAITFQIEVNPSGNNPDFVTVHTLPLPNALTDTSFGNPSYPFTMAAYSAGSTTDVWCKVGSYGGFIEGAKVLHGPRLSYTNTITTTGPTNLQALFSVRNTLYYGSRSNQSVINLLSVSGACKHNNPVVFYLIRNGALAGNPNFTSPSTSSSGVWDKVATTVTYSTEDQIIATYPLGETGNFDHHFGNGEYNAEEVTLQPGDMITLAVKSVTGNPTYVVGTINTREDQ